MKHFSKMIGFGFLIWLVPFIATFFMYSSNGQPLLELHFIKTLLVLIGTLVTVLLLTLYFMSISSHYLREGIIIGILWPVIYWVLDYFILVPMSNISVLTYFMEIGLRILTIPMISIAIGYLLAQKKLK